MHKYLNIIKESREKREAISKYFEENNISYISFDINNDEVKIVMSSADRFTFEFRKEEFVAFLKTINLRLSKF